MPDGFSPGRYEEAGPDGPNGGWAALAPAPPSTVAAATATARHVCAIARPPRRHRPDRHVSAVYRDRGSARSQPAGASPADPRADASARRDRVGLQVLD